MRKNSESKVGIHFNCNILFQKRKKDKHTAISDGCIKKVKREREEREEKEKQNEREKEKNGERKRKRRE
jgi:hypothetical protein